MIQHMKLKTILAVAVSLAAFIDSATTIVDLEDVETVTASQFNGYNGHTAGIYAASVADYALRFGKDVTIELDPAKTNASGVFTLYANIYATNGSFTVDATGIDTIRWIGGVRTAGKVIVKGAKAVRFGDAVEFGVDRANLSYFNTDMEFENAEATGLVFVNALTCAKLPKSCTWSIASGTRFAIDANGLFGGGAATFSLTDFDITLIETKGINAGEIVVPSGRTLGIRQCSRTQFNTTGGSIGRWTWGGEANNHVTNDIVFAAGSSLFVGGAQPNLYFDGVISGETDFTAAIGNSPGTIHFTKSVSLAGAMSVSDYTSFNLSGPGPFSFGTVTSSSQHNFTGPAGRVLSIAGLASGSIIGVGTGLDFTIGTAGAGAKVKLLGSGPWTVKGPASGEAANLDGALDPATSGGEVTLGGLMKLGDLGTTFSSVTLLDGAVLTDTTIDPSVKISGSGRVVHSGTSWTEKMYFWGDAQASSSIILLTNHWDLSGSSRLASNAKIVSGGPDYPLIWEWGDCRGASTGFAIRSLRCSDASEYNTISDPRSTYPFYASGVDVSESAQDYISFAGTSAGARQATLVKYSSGSWSPCAESTAYAIIVFGSQQGGGAGIIGSASAELNRTYSKTQAAATNPMFSQKNYATFTNGVAVVDSTVTGLNGGWQIISIDTESVSVSGLGFDKRGSTYATSSGSNRGYSNYAEVMLFKTAPAEFERMVAEEYLAAKWGLPCAHSNTRESVALTLGLSGEPSGSVLVEYPADDIPRAFTINLDFGAGTVRGAMYPLVKCAAGKCAIADTFTLGTVTGNRRAEDISLVYDSVTGTLNARIAETGLMLLIK